MQEASSTFPSILNLVELPDRNAPRYVTLELLHAMQDASHGVAPLLCFLMVVRCKIAVDIIITIYCESAV